MQERILSLRCCIVNRQLVRWCTISSQDLMSEVTHDAEAVRSVTALVEEQWQILIRVR